MGPFYGGGPGSQCCVCGPHLALSGYQGGAHPREYANCMCVFGGGGGLCHNACVMSPEETSPWPIKFHSSVTLPGQLKLTPGLKAAKAMRRELVRLSQDRRAANG